MASWPRFSDYADALLESGTLNDQGLRSLELVRDEDGRPRMRRGQSGTVFHFGTGHESYAFKVFTRNMADLRAGICTFQNICELCQARPRVLWRSHTSNRASTLTRPGIPP